MNDLDMEYVLIVFQELYTFSVILGIILGGIVAFTMSLFTHRRGSAYNRNVDR